MNTPSSIVPFFVAPAADDHLLETLRRCSPVTIEAARKFRQTGALVHVPVIVVGIIEHHVSRDLRSKLHSASDDARLREDLGLDSLSMMEIVLLVEDVLGVAIANEELRELRTLRDVKHFVAGKLSGPTRKM